MGVFDLCSKALIVFLWLSQCVESQKHRRFVGQDMALECQEHGLVKSDVHFILWQHSKKGLIASYVKDFGVGYGEGYQGQHILT